MGGEEIIFQLLQLNLNLIGKITLLNIGDKQKELKETMTLDIYFWYF